MRSPHYDSQQKTLYGVPLWLLFIDKECHYGGEMFFDQSAKMDQPQPGYNAAMYAAFDYMLRNLYKKMDSEEFKNIHYLCVNAVKNLEPNLSDFDPAGYGIDIDKVTYDARNEWQSKRLIGQSARYLSRFYLYFSHVQSNCSLKDAPKKTNELFEEYYCEIEKAQSEDEKLAVIVSLCEKLEIGHYFGDGNQRTNAFVLLNKLLLENNFYPAILDDPIIFDGYLSTLELVEAVKKGMKCYSLLASLLNEDRNLKLLDRNTLAAVFSTLSDQPELLNDQMRVFFAKNAKHAAPLAKLISMIHKINPVLITSDFLNLLNAHAHHASRLIVSIKDLDYTSLIKQLNKEKLKFLVENAESISELHGAIFLLHHQSPVLVNKRNLKFLIDHKEYASNLALVINVWTSKRGTIYNHRPFSFNQNPVSFNNYNYALLSENAKFSYHIYNILFILPADLVNDINLTLILEHAQYAEKIASALEQLKKIKSPITLEIFNRLIATCADEINKDTGIVNQNLWNEKNKAQSAASPCLEKQNHKGYTC